MPPVDATRSPSRSSVSWAEFMLALLLLVGGFCFLQDAPRWAGNVYIGNVQFGDAEFWWNGALHFSRGIVAENPNLTYRMGYAAFAGSAAAVLGPDYRAFHRLLLALFLVVATAGYFSLRGSIGRLAAAVTVILFVFNPYTGEWLAISTSDSLGLVLNLGALLALVAGVRDGLRRGPLALFGVFLSLASLTRPLMTPFLVPAALAVAVAGGRAWRPTLSALGVMFAAFLLPTLAWMGFMGATTGNFALTGGAQDSSAFYAASDPQIQTWRAEIYTAVDQSAQRRHHVDHPTTRQLNQEFWLLTVENYTTHWRFHVTRLWHHLGDLAGFTVKRLAGDPPTEMQWPRLLKWVLTLGLGIFALRQQRQWPAVAIFALGAAWTLNAAAPAGLVLLGAAAGLVALFFRRPVPFIWAAYWWVGAAALYLTGGTWGPPVNPNHELTGLGYRLGFQFLFANDLLVAGLLGTLAGGRTNPDTFADYARLLAVPSVQAARLLRTGLVLFVAVLAGVLVTGAGIVGWRIVARGHTAPAPYPNPAGLTRTAAARGALVAADIATVRAAVNAQAGAPVLFTGMSSGFLWNLPGQERCMLLLYQQDNVQPVSMSPRHVFAEVPRHLPEHDWVNRQGAWVLRSFRGSAPPSNLPYYFETPAVQAFIPLAADGQSYDIARAEIFPLAKAATQLAAEGSLTITGAPPQWVANSGWQKYPRRFGLHPPVAGGAVAWEIDLARTRGKRTFSCSLQIEGRDNLQPPRPMRLETTDGVVLWSGELTAIMPAVRIAPVIPAEARGLRFVTQGLPEGDSLWFYEFVLQADDFAP